MIDVGGEVILGLNELELGLKCGVHLCELAELLLLDLVYLLGLLDFVTQILGDLGLRVDVLLETLDDLGRLAVLRLGLLKVAGLEQLLLVELELLIEELLELLLLLVKLDGQLLIVLLSCLLLSDKLLNLYVLITLQFGLKALQCKILLGSSLLLELFIFDFSESLSLSELLLLVVEVLGDVLELLYLDLLHLEVDAGVEYLLAQLGLLGEPGLVLDEAGYLGLDIAACRLEVLDLELLVGDQLRVELDLHLVTHLAQLVECVILDYVHSALVVFVALPVLVLLLEADVVLGVDALLGDLLELPVELGVSLEVDGVVVALLVLHLLVLREHDVDLRVEHELLPDDLELELVQLLDALVVVATHLLVLLLEEGDVLEGGLLVVEERADAGLLLVLHDLLLQDLQLQLHEVNLLLQVLDVLVLN